MMEWVHAYETTSRNIENEVSTKTEILLCAGMMQPSYDRFTAFVL